MHSSRRRSARMTTGDKGTDPSSPTRAMHTEAEASEGMDSSALLAEASSDEGTDSSSLAEAPTGSAGGMGGAMRLGGLGFYDTATSTRPPSKR